MGERDGSVLGLWVRAGTCIIRYHSASFFFLSFLFESGMAAGDFNSPIEVLCPCLRQKKATLCFVSRWHLACNLLGMILGSVPVN